MTEQTYGVDGNVVSNLEAQLHGSHPTEGAIVVGAHYDSVDGREDDNDNPSGVAAALELARSLCQSKMRRTVRFVLFVNEEPSYFRTAQMGSLVYTKKLHDAGTSVSAMISLETLGFVSNKESRGLVRRAVRSFRETAQFPSEAVAAPPNWPGIAWSDQWSFWQKGHPTSRRRAEGRRDNIIESVTPP